MKMNGSLGGFNWTRSRNRNGMRGVLYDAMYPRNGLSGSGIMTGDDPVNDSAIDILDDSGYMSPWAAMSGINEGESLEGLGDLVDTTSQPTTDIWGNISNTVQNVATSYLTYKQQSDLNAINLERAKTGLSPLSPSQYAPTVNFGVNSETQKMLMYGGIALLLVLLLKRA